MLWNYVKGIYSPGNRSARLPRAQYEGGEVVVCCERDKTYDGEAATRIWDSSRNMHVLCPVTLEQLK